jgi:hypothetical protein
MKIFKKILSLNFIKKMIMKKVLIIIKNIMKWLKNNKKSAIIMIIIHFIHIRLLQI